MRGIDTPSPDVVTHFAVDDEAVERKSSAFREAQSNDFTPEHSIKQPRANPWQSRRKDTRPSQIGFIGCSTGDRDDEREHDSTRYVVSHRIPMHFVVWQTTNIFLRLTSSIARAEDLKAT